MKLCVGVSGSPEGEGSNPIVLTWVTFVLEIDTVGDAFFALQSERTGTRHVGEVKHRAAGMFVKVVNGSVRWCLRV